MIYHDIHICGWKVGSNECQCLRRRTRPDGKCNVGIRQAWIVHVTLVASDQIGFFFFLFLFFKRKKYLRKCTVRIWAISRERSTFWHHDQISSSFGGLGKTANRTHPIILRAHIQLPNKAMGSASSTQGRDCSRPQPRPYILWNHDRHHHSPCNAFVFLTEDPVMMGWPRYSLIAIQVLKVGFTKKGPGFCYPLAHGGAGTRPLNYQLYFVSALSIVQVPAHTGGWAS